MADLKKILIEFTEFLELHGAEGIRKGVEMYVEEFERTNDTVKDHLFMIDVIKGEANERHELKEALEMIANLEYDEIPGEFGAQQFAKRRLFEKLKLIKPRHPHLPQTNVSGSFKEWYLEFRSEMAKSFGVNYSISIASWTFSDNHKHYYDKGLTPKEAVLEYAASKNCH